MIRRAGTTVHILTWTIELLSIFVSVVFRKYTLLKNVTPFIVWKWVQIRCIFYMYFVSWTYSVLKSINRPERKPSNESQNQSIEGVVILQKCPSKIIYYDARASLGIISDGSVFCRYLSILFGKKRHKTKTIKFYTRQTALLRIERESSFVMVSQSPYVSCNITFE